MVSLEGISFGYGGRRTLSEVSLRLPPGSFHFLTGPSGAGKTTLLKLLYLEHRPQSGRLVLFGEDPAWLDRPARTRLRRRIGVVFQDFRLLDHLNLRENVALPLRVAGKPLAGREDDIDDLLRWAGLTERAEARPPELSAGEKQRAAIARAMIHSPDLIVADEPTGNVDPDMGARILRLLVELNKQGRTILVATHDRELIRAAGALTDARILRLAEGRLVETTGGA